MRLLIIVIIITLMHTGCIKECNCPPDKTTYKIVKQSLRDYFPYKPGQKIKFAKFIDTVSTGEVIFMANSPSVTHQTEHESDDCCTGGMYFEYEDIELFHLKLSNLTEPGKDCNIGITGNYAKNLYQNDIDLSDLVINLYGSNFEFGMFGVAVFDGSPYYNVDSIFINNKNYGLGFCIRPTYTTRIYFNSTFGILKYINESTKEQLVYTE
ncbi:MAG: hypothetical protein Q8M15_12690 [Bacteroidota bacterium]|nr:hypothetical protein [Bacteroidota bacterium]